MAYRCRSPAIHPNWHGDCGLESTGKARAENRLEGPRQVNRIRLPPLLDHTELAAWPSGFNPAMYFMNGMKGGDSDAS